MCFQPLHIPHPIDSPAFSSCHSAPSVWRLVFFGGGGAMFPKYFSLEVRLVVILRLFAWMMIMVCVCTAWKHCWQNDFGGRQRQRWNDQFHRICEFDGECRCWTEDEHSLSSLNHKSHVEARDSIYIGLFHLQSPYAAALCFSASDMQQNVIVIIIIITKFMKWTNSSKLESEVLLVELLLPMHGSTLGQGQLPQPCPANVTWKTDELTASAYRCKKELSLAFKMCKDALLVGALPWTTLWEFTMLPGLPSWLGKAGRDSAVLAPPFSHIRCSLSGTSICGGGRNERRLLLPAIF